MDKVSNCDTLIFDAMLQSICLMSWNTYVVFIKGKPRVQILDKIKDLIESHSFVLPFKIPVP